MEKGIRKDRFAKSKGWRGHKQLHQRSAVENYRDFQPKGGGRDPPTDLRVRPRLRLGVWEAMAPRQGYPRGYRRGGHSPPGSSSRQPDNEAPSSRVQREAFNTTHSFYTSIPPCFQDHVEEVK
jgi:hypothetical protein